MVLPLVFYYARFLVLYSLLLNAWFFLFFKKLCIIIKTTSYKDLIKNKAVQYILLTKEHNLF